MEVCFILQQTGLMYCQNIYSNLNLKNCGGAGKYSLFSLYVVIIASISTVKLF